MEGSVSQDDVYEGRERICDLGYLREAYRTPSGKIAFRCPSEPENVYVAKGGDVENTVGRKCICNALLASVGMPQIRKGGNLEPSIVTSGDDLVEIERLLPPGRRSYTAADVISNIIGA